MSPKLQSLNTTDVLNVEQMMCSGLGRRIHMHGINFTLCIKRVFVAVNLHAAVWIACSANPHCLVAQSPNNSIHASFICRPSPSPVLHR